LLCIEADGKNPFEELGFIHSDWTDDEKIEAVRIMKETDCLPALLHEAIEKAPASASASIKVMANMLLANPVERMKAMGLDFDNLNDTIRDSIGLLKQEQSAESTFQKMQIEQLSRVALSIELANINSEQSDTEDEAEVFDPFSFLSYLRQTSLIPNCVSCLVPSLRRVQISSMFSDRCSTSTKL
jgi:hypothetical protein